MEKSEVLGPFQKASLWLGRPWASRDLLFQMTTWPNESEFYLTQRKGFSFAQDWVTTFKSVSLVTVTHGGCSPYTYGHHLNPSFSYTSPSTMPSRRGHCSLRESIEGGELNSSCDLANSEDSKKERSWRHQFSSRVCYAKCLRQEIFQILNFSVLEYLHMYGEIPYNFFTHMPWR